MSWSKTLLDFPAWRIDYSFVVVNEGFCIEDTHRQKRKRCGIQRLQENREDSGPPRFCKHKMPGIDRGEIRSCFSAPQSLFHCPAAVSPLAVDRFGEPNAWLRRVFILTISLERASFTRRVLSCSQLNYFIYSFTVWRADRITNVICQSSVIINIWTCMSISRAFHIIILAILTLRLLIVRYLTQLLEQCACESPARGPILPALL